MQNHDLAHKNARLARVLYDIEKTGATRWEPSREDLLKLRAMSREGFSMRGAYDEMNLKITYATFTRRIKQYAIVFTPPWSHKCVR